MLRLGALVVVFAGILAVAGLAGLHLADHVIWPNYYRGVATFGDRCDIAITPWSGDFGKALAAPLAFRSHPMPHRGTTDAPRVLADQVLVTRCTVPTRGLADTGFRRLSLGIVYGDSMISLDGHVVAHVNHLNEVTLPLGPETGDHDVALVVASRGAEDGLAGLATLIPPYVSNDVARTQMIDRFLAAWNGEHPAFELGMASILLALLGLLWRSGFRYDDVAWNIVHAAAYCALQGTYYLRQFLSDFRVEQRVEAVLGIIVSVATFMFIRSFLRLPGRRAHHLAALAIVLLSLGTTFVSSTVFLEWQLLSRAESLGLAASLAALLIFTRRHAAAQADALRRRRLRLMQRLGWVAVATNLVQVFLELRYAITLAPAIQIALLATFSFFLLQDLLASQGLYAQEREARIAQTEKAVRARTVAQLAQLVAHDVRRPFRIIRTLGTLLQRARTPQDARDVLERLLPRVAQTEAQILGMLDDVLATNDPSAVPRDAGPVSIYAVVAEACEHVALAIDEPRDVALAYQLTDARSLSGHHARYVRVVQNVLENAVRATPDGGRITLSLAPGKTPDTVRLSLHNASSVIPPERIATLFDVGTSERGSGYGLAAVRSIVEGYGGTCACESSAEKGTTFHFELPANDLQAAAQALPSRLTTNVLTSEAPKSQDALPRIAVIDDDTFSEFAWRQLGDDVAPEFWRDPASFLERAQRAPEFLATFRVILLDFHFLGRGETGLSVAYALERLDPTLAVIILSDARLPTATFPPNVRAVLAKSVLPWRDIEALLASKIGAQG